MSSALGLPRVASGDCVLEVIENLDVHIVGRAVESEQFTKSPVVIVLVGELEDGFAGHAAKPDNGTANELVVPFAGGDFPRMGYTCEILGCGEIDHNFGVGMGLEE